MQDSIAKFEKELRRLNLKNKNILLGVTGGIAAYKAAELVRLFKKAGANVRVLMTEAAKHFVQPLTFQALSGYPVVSDLWAPEAPDAMDHIALARWADQVVIAPASADCIARIAHGMANDLLTSTCLATEAPIAVAPAMNQQMWLAMATQKNVRILEAHAIKILGPGSGEQACKEVGPGRMLEPEQILSLLNDQIVEKPVGQLSGIKILITAGPTQEPLDPVRYLTNESSGKMGYALATAAIKEGADVCLVSGPVTLISPKGCQCMKVSSALEMYDAVMTQLASVDIFIGAAAVSDYRPQRVQTQKIKKSEDEIHLTLVKNPDILKKVAAAEHPPFTVGFAAETEQVEDYAENKRQDKKLDMIMANKVGQGLGFHVDNNAITALWEQGRRDFPQQPKTTLANALITLIAERYHAKNSS